MSDHNVLYFRNLLSSEKSRINVLCSKWREAAAVAEVSIPEDMEGQIRTTIGQAELLMNQRFKQFEGLIDNCEFNIGDMKTTCEDLDGFWDMVYFQVEDIDKKFNALVEAEKNNWAAKEVNAVAPKRRSRVLKPSNSTTKLPTAKNMALEAKKRLAQAKEQKVVNENAEKENQKMFEAPGFFVINSPIKKDIQKKESSMESTRKTPLKSNPRTPKNSLLIAQITRSARKALNVSEMNDQ